MKEARWEVVYWTITYGEKTWEESFIAVHIFKDGEYTGVGTFCSTVDEAEAFAIKCNCGKFVKMEGYKNVTDA